MLRPGEEIIMAWKGGHKELCVEPKWELQVGLGFSLLVCVKDFMDRLVYQSLNSKNNHETRYFGCFFRFFLDACLLRT